MWLLYYEQRLVYAVNRHRNKDLIMTSRPLDGIRVVDLTHVLAGPYCSYQLGLLGAEVIKVEPLSGDLVRLEVPGADHVRHGYGFMAQNAGNVAFRLISLSPSFVLELATGADVFLENYSPGSLARHGLGYDDVAAVNDTVVYARFRRSARPGHGHRPGSTMLFRRHLV